MADDWRDHWDRLLALQERIEQHATGRKGSPIDASADFASFVVESENLRDGVKRTLSGSAKAVDSAMRSATSLQLAHDLAIKVKHEVQSRKPWSTAEDAGYDVKLSKGVPDSPSPFERRARSTTLPGTPPSPAPEPTRWAHQWEIRYTPSGSPTLTVDGVQFSRDVAADWRTILAAHGLV